MTEVSSSPAISGNRRSPDTVGLTPLTICRNSGRKVMAPNMAKPTTNPTALAAENTRLANRCSGITGSAARRSARTKATMSTTPATPSPTIGAEPQA